LISWIFLLTFFAKDFALIELTGMKKKLKNEFHSPLCHYQFWYSLLTAVSTAHWGVTRTGHWLFQRAMPSVFQRPGMGDMGHQAVAGSNCSNTCFLSAFLS